MAEDLGKPEEEKFDFTADGEAVIQRLRTKMGHLMPELCSRSLRPGRYLVNVENGVPTFLPAWWPGTVDRTMALPVKVKAGAKVVLEPLFVTLAGSIRFIFGQMPVEGEWRIEIQDGIEDASPDWLPVDPELVAIVEPTQWVVPFPVGTWNLRLCDDEDCDVTALWTSDASTTVDVGETVEVTVPKIPPPEVGFSATADITSQITATKD